MGKEKKEKKKKSKTKGGLLGRLRRSSAVDDSAAKKEQLSVPTPENDGQKNVAPRKKSKVKRGLFRGSNAEESPKNAKGSKGKSAKGKEAKMKVLPGQTSYSQNKPKIKKSKKKKKPRKKPDVEIKRGNQARDGNKYFPGTVSYKYTSPEEVWVEFLGRTPEVNDYGNGARLMLDETDN